MTDKFQTEFSNLWFWTYLGLIILFTTVWFLKIPSETFKILAAFGLAISQLIYNLKVKIDEEAKVYPNFLRWSYFILLLLFAIVYTSAVLKEITISIITLLITFGAILLSTLILNFSNLWKSKSIFWIIIFYLALAFTSIILFGYIFTIISSFEDSRILDSKGQPIKGAWEYVYFSSSVFYSNTFGETPNGLSKLFVQIELAFSFIVHIIVLGSIVNSLNNKN
ncbi:hypothetical protein HYY70_06580 [Candidatus Woesearchaeota archaeon]|nr:hypothetical protein [Candidatus Woesearchaeota archaeon]